MSGIDTKKQRVANHKWYKKNKDDLNKKRREDYKKNKDVRIAARERAKKQREEGPKEMDEVLHREIGGKRIKVYRIGTVSNIIGKYHQTIRNWEDKGYIPTPTIEGGQRLYTENQVALMQRIVESNTNKRAQKKDSKEQFDEVIKYVKENWDN